MYDTLVSTDVLDRNLGSGWAIIDCRTDLQQEDWGRQQYEAGHVPGAVYASLGRDLSGPVSPTTGRHPLPSVARMEALFGELGIGPDTQVVAYDQDFGAYASRLWWMLRYVGHEATAVLDGGWAKWVREERPVRSGDERRRAAAFVAAPRPQLHADLAAVLASTADPDVLLLDARAPERFEGRNEPLDRVAGHIPGAVNHFYKENLAGDGTLLPAGTLRERFEASLGGHDAATTIVYCGSGVTACHNLLAMEVAGLHGARLFSGSWSEWSKSPERPIETGPAKRA